MDFSSIFYSILVLGVLGFLFGILYESLVLFLQAMFFHSPFI